MKLLFPSGFLLSLTWVFVNRAFTVAPDATKPPDAKININTIGFVNGFNASSVVVADFNKDGKPDFATSSPTEVVWFDMPNRGRHSIKKASEALDNVQGLAHAALDIDGDGAVDLVSAEGSSHALVWYECPSPPTNEDWKRHVIDADLPGLHEVIVANLDGDHQDAAHGKPQLVANGGGKLYAYRIPANAKSDPRWERIEIAKDATGSIHSLSIVDFNARPGGRNDKRPDLLLVSSSDGYVAWWENPGAGALTQVWKRHDLVTGLFGVTHAQLADIDGDGQDDLVLACGHSTGLFWYRRSAGAKSGAGTKGDAKPAPAKGKGKTAPPPRPPARADTWEKQVIDADFKAPHALVVADLDGDGKVDVAAVSRQSREVAWWENQRHDAETGGPGDRETRFLKRTIVPQNQSAYEMKLVDFGPPTGVGLLVAGKESNNVVFYQIIRKTPAKSAPPAKGAEAKGKA